MNKTTISRITLAATTLLVAIALAAPRNGRHQGPLGTPLANGPRHVDLVIALDVSGSMNGLIDSARQKLWDTVNLLAQAQPKPVLRVGLISYGNDGYDPSVGWVRKDSDLTTDLDGIYAKLFALSTNGGTEYVARAVTTAVDGMKWDQSPGALKIVFVAGNEPATQDPQIPLTRAIGAARDKGIFVNAIYCGADSAFEAAGWREVAQLGSGRYAAIDQDHVAMITTPFDADLSRLSAELNRTYVSYGTDGLRRAENQAAQDKNALSASPAAAASRAVAKSSPLYDNSGWDLVDARSHGVEAGKMDPSLLPQPMKAMSPADRERFVTEKAQERQTVQKQISELSARRDAYLKAERARKAGPRGGAALDDALNGAVRSQAEAKGFKF
jgi:hypothetical protein